MSIASNIIGNTVTISISGRFDFNSHGEFREAYSATDGNESNYKVDLSETDYIDSSALGMLLLLREHAGNENSKISLLNASSEVKEILMISNFDKLFTIS